MSPTLDLIGKYLENAAAVVQAAAETGLPLAVACALVEKESDGRNIYGGDIGGVYAPEYPNKIVTEANFKAFLKKIKTQTSNGVGPCQITWKGYFPKAQAQGYKLWIPFDNMVFGFKIILSNKKQYKTWRLAGQHYNGSGPRAVRYGIDFEKKIAQWENRLKTAAETPGENAVSTKVTWRGKKFDARTAKMLAELAKKTSAYIRPTQGSYNTSVGASAGTHAGGGAVDISVSGLTSAQKQEIVREARKIGFAAWLRLSSEGPWAEHIHMIAIGCPDLSGSASRQVTAYKKGLSGLASGKKDRHASMGIKPTTWENYLKDVGSPATAPKATVSISKVIQAAKLDPAAKAGSAYARKDVKLIEDALVINGYLDKKWADGSFGTETIKAYKKLQTKYGYKGKAANGIPGEDSLTRFCTENHLKAVK